MSDSQVEVHNEGDMGEDAKADMLATLAIIALLVSGVVFWVAGA